MNNKAFRIDGNQLIKTINGKTIVFDDLRQVGDRTQFLFEERSRGSVPSQDIDFGVTVVDEATVLPPIAKPAQPTRHQKKQKSPTA